MPSRSTPSDRLDRREFLTDLLCGGAAAGAVALGFATLPESRTQRRRASDPAPVALTFASGAPIAVPVADNPFEKTSTPAILARLAKAEPSHAKQLLSILANSKILSDPPLEKLSPYLSHRDPEIVAGALEVIAKRKSLPVDEAFLRRHLGDERERVRLAVVDLMAERDDVAVDEKRLDELHRLAPKGRMASVLHFDAILDLVAARKPAGSMSYLVSRHGIVKSDDLPKAIAAAKIANFERLNELELLRAAGELSPQALLRGAELRIARRLLARVDPEGRAEGDAMPLLHIFRSIDESFPGYLDEVHGEPGRLRALGKELLGAVRRERAAEIAASRDLMRREVNVLVGLHDEYSSWPDRAEERIRAVMQPARVNGVEVIYPPLTERGIESPKKTYRTALAKLVSDREKLSVIWNTGHGGPRHFWFLAGGIGEHLSENLAHESGISHEELAATLVSAASKGGKLDLSHVVLIQDACFQMDFALNLYAAIFSAAGERSLTVEGLPRVVSASQRGLPSWLARSFAAQIEEDADKKIPFTMREPGSFLQNAFRETSKREGTLLERILMADGMLGRELEKEIDEPEGDLGGQDLAVFSPRVVDLEKLVNEAAGRLSKRKVELPELPPRKSRSAASKVMQIASGEGSAAGSFA